MLAIGKSDPVHIKIENEEKIGCEQKLLVLGGACKKLENAEQALKASLVQCEVHRVVQEKLDELTRVVTALSTFIQELHKCIAESKMNIKTNALSQDSLKKLDGTLDKWIEAAKEHLDGTVVLRKRVSAWQTL